MLATKPFVQSRRGASTQAPTHTTRRRLVHLPAGNDPRISQESLKTHHHPGRDRGPRPRARLGAGGGACRSPDRTPELVALLRAIPDPRAVLTPCGGRTWGTCPRAPEHSDRACVTLAPDIVSPVAERDPRMRSTAQWEDVGLPPCRHLWPADESGAEPVSRPDRHVDRTAAQAGSDHQIGVPVARDVSRSDR